jgi:hypothetical protein
MTNFHTGHIQHSSHTKDGIKQASKKETKQKTVFSLRSLRFVIISRWLFSICGCCSSRDLRENDGSATCNLETNKRGTWQ